MVVEHAGECRARVMSRDDACRGRRGAARPTRALHCAVQILSAGVRAQINALGRAAPDPRWQPPPGLPTTTLDLLAKPGSSSPRYNYLRIRGKVISRKTGMKSLGFLVVQKPTKIL